MPRFLMACAKAARRRGVGGLGGRWRVEGGRRIRKRRKRRRKRWQQDDQAAPVRW